MQLRFKKCGIEDLDLLVDISKKTFIAAFEAQNDPDDFKTYLEEAFKSAKLKKEVETPEASFYFVYADEELAGYFKLNVFQAQTDIKADESLEIERIYVLAAFQGKKIGQAMLTEIKSIALQQGKQFLWLGVWEQNAAAIRFYEREGFTKFGTHPYYIGSDEQTDWLLRYQL